MLRRDKPCFHRPTLYASQNQVWKEDQAQYTWRHDGVFSRWSWNQRHVKYAVSPHRDITLLHVHYILHKTPNAFNIDINANPAANNKIKVMVLTT